MNCAGLSPALLESELFGHEKGAFTDAQQSKPGLLEIASGGTVFLDEIGEMPLEVQSKLLKVLESRRFRRVGGIRDISTNVRLIAASNRDLKDALQVGEFREDLYYRLNVFAINIRPAPPPTTSSSSPTTLGELNRIMGTRVEGFEPTASDILKHYFWPGNVRELRNVVERAVILVRQGQIAPPPARRPAQAVAHRRRRRGAAARRGRGRPRHPRPPEATLTAAASSAPPSAARHLTPTLPTARSRRTDPRRR
jgi:transcriptional regulator with PAS, ATPase and Fis domain